VIGVAVTEEALAIGSVQGGKVGELGFGEGEIVEEVGGGSGAGDNGGVATEGGASVEEVEDGLAVGHFILPVSVAHGELVEIGEEGGLGVHSCEIWNGKDLLREADRGSRFSC
jgi:hypothetical protein